MCVSGLLERMTRVLFQLLVLLDLLGELQSRTWMMVAFRYVSMALQFPSVVPCRHEGQAGCDGALEVASGTDSHVERGGVIRA